MKMPPNIGPVHFIGIGGIGMSGIAEVLVNLGYTVQGSDQSENANVQRLRDKGVTVHVGHAAENLGKAEVVVVSTAIKRSNPELAAARDRLLPIVRRAEMLAELMRFRQAIAIGGTHGKTTTTSMVATLLDAGDLDPTVVNGGIINAYGTNARMGGGDWMVVEADESDGTFLKLPADVVVVTNIDPEHLDHYGTFDKVRAAFRTFVENVPFYGFAVMCLDHPEVQTLVSEIEDRRIITYGENPQADVRFEHLTFSAGKSRFDVTIRDRIAGDTVSIEGLALPMPGRHNVSNATAAIAVAHRLGLSADQIRKGLDGFGGVKRRFTHTGQSGGVDIFDDYGHHPVEIRAVLAARAGLCGRPRRRRRPAASLHAPAGAVSRFRGMLQRRRHRHPRPGLRRRRGADRVRQFRDAGRTPEARRPSRRPAHRRSGRARAADPPRDQPRRHGRLPRRRFDHPMGLCAAEGTRRAGGLRTGHGRGRRRMSAGAMDGGPMDGGQIDGAPIDGRRLLADLGDRMKSVRGRLTPNAAMEKITWFRAGGPAELLFQPTDEADLATFLKNLPTDIPVMVVGIGSNLLVRDGGIAGVVIRLSARGFGTAERIGDTQLRAGAATPDKRLAATALEAGLGGFHFYHGIPGSIGGALRMNAGANGTETRERVVEVRAVDRMGDVHILSNAEMGYAYRHSSAARDLIFTSALFEGEPAHPADIRAKMDEVQHHRETVQPVREKTGGSTFKNPDGSSAWKEIDKAGCRGLKVGDAQMSELHCNFMINTATATGHDLETLGETVRARVLQTSGIRLDWEIKRLGIFDEGREVWPFLGEG